jgi:hypothetical protein
MGWNGKWVRAEQNGKLKACGLPSFSINKKEFKVKTMEDIAPPGTSDSPEYCPEIDDDYFERLSKKPQKILIFVLKIVS